MITAVPSTSPLPRTMTRSAFQSERSSCSASEIRQPLETRKATRARSRSCGPSTPAPGWAATRSSSSASRGLGSRLGSFGRGIPWHRPAKMSPADASRPFGWRSGRWTAPATRSPQRAPSHRTRHRRARGGRRDLAAALEGDAGEEGRNGRDEEDEGRPHGAVALLRCPRGFSCVSVASPAECCQGSPRSARRMSSGPTSQSTAMSTWGGLRCARTERFGRAPAEREVPRRRARRAGSDREAVPEADRDL